MDSIDIFKKLTANLVFDKNKETLKRKIDQVEEEEQPASKVAVLDSKKSAKKSKKLKKDKKEKEVNLADLHSIRVSGSDVPQPIASFDELFDKKIFKKTYEFDLSEQLIANMKSYDFPSLTPIQMQVIPLMLNQRPVLACSPTGSGKTFSFLFPIIAHLQIKKQINGISALILAPTRELAQQIYFDCTRLCVNTNLAVQIIHNEVKNFSGKCDILITTPSRLIHLLEKEAICKAIKTVEWLIVDEADKLFEDGKKGFREQLAIVYKSVENPKVKHCYFSATNSKQVEQWCKLNEDSLVQVTIGKKNSAPKTIEQDILYVGNEEGKLIELRNIFRQGFQPPLIIFVDSKEKSNLLFKELIYEDVKVDVINADRTQQQRENSLMSFRQGKIWVLICTELLSRGIDFKRVNFIINYDFPHSTASYLHRIGRSGRAGRQGKAITFFTDQDMSKLKGLVNFMKRSGVQVPEYLSKFKREYLAKRKITQRNNNEKSKKKMTNSNQEDETNQSEDSRIKKVVKKKSNKKQNAKKLKKTKKTLKKSKKIKLKK